MIISANTLLMLAAFAALGLSMLGIANENRLISSAGQILGIIIVALIVVGYA